MSVTLTAGDVVVVTSASLAGANEAIVGAALTLKSHAVEETSPLELVTVATTWLFPGLSRPSWAGSKEIQTFWVMSPVTKSGARVTPLMVRVPETMA